MTDLPLPDPSWLGVLQNVCSTYAPIIQAVGTAVLVLTLAFVGWNAYLQRELVRHGKLPAVGFGIRQDGGELRFWLRNYSSFGVTAKLDMRTRAFGSPVSLREVYAGDRSWPLLPRDEVYGAAFLIKRCLEKRFPRLSEKVDAIPDLREVLQSSPGNRQSTTGANGGQAEDPCLKEMREILELEETNGGRGLEFDIKIICATHRTRVTQDTPRRKWDYKFATGQLIPDF